MNYNKKQMSRDTPTTEFNIEFYPNVLIPYMDMNSYPKFSIAIEYGEEYGDYDEKEFIIDFPISQTQQLEEYIENGQLHTELEEYKNYNHLEVNIYYEYDRDSLELVDTIYQKEE